MSQDLKIESPNRTFFITTRTQNSRLWFVNARQLEERILAYLAKYQSDYRVILYNFILMGNHYHLSASFPDANKSAFMRSFNSIIAKLTKSYCEAFDGGTLWARRYRDQVLLEPSDIEHWCFYAALNPVSSGLTKKVRHYSGYNSFSDAASGKSRKFKIIDWTDYNNRKRYNSSLTPEDCATEYHLTFSRLPGYEEFSQSAYRRFMNSTLECRQMKLVEARLKNGEGFCTSEQLKRTIAGAKPKSTKSSSRSTKRPLVLTLSASARKRYLEWYFGILNWFKEASRRYLLGEVEVQFPPGTYRPPRLLTPH